MVGTILGVSFFVDAVLFFVGGVVSDRYGRRFAAIPTSFNMGVAFLVLSFSSSIMSIFFSAVFFGVADALGAGLLNTLCGDCIPKKASGRFVGLFRVMLDSGQFIGPLLVAGLSAMFSFRLACIGIGLIGIFNAWWAWKVLPFHLETTETLELTGGSTTEACPEREPDDREPRAEEK
jgi:MFS family permease